MIKWWRRCLLLLAWSIGLFAITLIGLNLSLNGWLPLSLSQPITALLEQRLQLQINYTDASIQWRSNKFYIQVDGLRIRNQQSQLSVAVDHLQLDLNWLTSLRKGIPIFTNIVTNHVQINANVTSNSTPTNELTTFTPLLLSADSIDINRLQLHVNYDNEPWLAIDAALMIENNHHFHRLKLIDSMADEQPIFVVELKGEGLAIETMAGQGYLQLSTDLLERWLVCDTQCGMDHLKAIELQTWFDIHESLVINWRGHFNASGIFPIFGDQNIDISSSFLGSHNDKQSIFEWHDLQVKDTAQQWPVMDWRLTRQSQSSIQPSSQSSAQPSIQTWLLASGRSIDLQQWKAVLLSIPILSSKAVDILTQLDLAGRIENLQLSLPNSAISLHSLKIKGNIYHSSNQRYRNSPTFSGIDGYFETSLTEGFIDLDSPSVSALYHTVYTQPMHYNDLRGRLHWQIKVDQQLLLLHSDILTLTFFGSKVKGQFSLRQYLAPNKAIPIDAEGYSDPNRLDLTIKLQNINAKYWRTLTPTTLSATGYDYLEQHIDDRLHVTSGMLVLRDVLNHKGVERYQLILDVEGSHFNYWQSWPEVSDLKSQVTVTDGLVDIQIQQAMLWQSQLHDVSIQLLPLINTSYDLNGGLRLHMRGRFVGNADDALNLLRQPDLHEEIGDNLDSFSLHGEIDASVDIDFSIPKNEQFSPRVDVEAKLTKGQLQVADSPFVITDINGTLNYNEQKLSANHLQGKLWEQDISAVINTSDNYQIDFKTHVDLAELRQQLDINFLDFISGTTAIKGTLLIPPQSSLPTSQKTRHYLLSTDMYGAKIDLPATFLGKDTKDRTPLTINVEHIDQQQTLSIDKMDGSLKSQFRYRIASQGKESQLLAALMFINSHPTAIDTTLSDGKFYLHADVDSVTPTMIVKTLEAFDVNKDIIYTSTGDRKAPTINGLKPFFNIHINELKLSDHDAIDDINIQISTNPASWSIAFEQANIAGDININSLADSFPRVHLSHLYFNEPTTNETTNDSSSTASNNHLLSNTTPQDWPAMDVIIDDLQWQNKSLGSWQWQMRHRQNGLLINNIRNSQFTKNLTIENNNQLFWFVDETGQHTVIDLDVQFADIDQAVSLFYPDKDILNSRDAQIKGVLKWADSPSQFASDKLNGHINFNFQQGTFKQPFNGSNIGSRLLNLINVNNWLRRLKLDFEDVVSTGTSYDSINGNVNIDNGLISTVDPAKIKLPSVTLDIDGSANFIDDSIDAEIIAYLPIRNNASILAGLLISWPVALGVYATSSLLDGVGNFNQIAYTVTGKLSDPQVKAETITSQ